MAHLAICSQLKEFHQQGKFTLLKNRLVSLETLLSSAVCQEKLFSTHLVEAEVLLLQLKNAIEKQSELSLIPYSTKESSSGWMMGNLHNSITEEELMDMKLADEINEIVQKEGDFC